MPQMINLLFKSLKLERSKETNKHLLTVRSEMIEWECTVWQERQICSNISGFSKTKAIKIALVGDKCSAQQSHSLWRKNILTLSSWLIKGIWGEGVRFYPKYSEMDFLNNIEYSQQWSL